MAQATYQKKLDDLQQAFKNADTENKGRLTENQFKEFVQIGFKKECPDGMYGYLCQHYKVDPSLGLTWKTALAIWKESNPPPKNNNSHNNNNKSSKTPAPPGKHNNHSKQSMSKSKSPQPGSSGNGVSFAASPNGSHGSGMGGLTRSKTDRTSRMSRTNLGDFSKDSAARNRSPSPGGTIRGHTRDKSLSNSMSSKTRSYRNGAIGNGSSVSGGTSSHIDSFHGRVGSGSINDSDLSDATSEHSLPRSTSVRTSGVSMSKRMSALTRSQTLIGSQALSGLRLDRKLSNDGTGNDASSMVVQMMETKLKTAQSNLKDERKKRKKADETTQQLLITNEKFKQQLSEAETRCKKLERELKKSQDDAKKFRAMVEDDRNTITQLRSQLKTEKSDSAEAFKLLRKMEEQHDQHVSKLKKKHSQELEKQSNGFLQTLGVDPSSGQDVREFIRELKEEKENLNNQVDMLAETLARKEQSLIHALQVLDDLSQMKSRRGSLAIGDETKQGDLAAAPKLSKRQSIAENFKNNVIQGLSKSGHKPNGMGMINENNNRNNRGSSRPGKINMNANTINGQTNANTSGKVKSPLPAPPSNRRSNPKQVHTADFFRNAVSPRYYGNLGGSFQNDTVYHKNSRLNKNKTGTNIQGSNKTKIKSMEMLNNSLVSDVVNKQDAIDELSVANNTLVDQVMNLQKQLDDMHRSSTIFMQENDMKSGKNGKKTGKTNNSNNNNTTKNRNDNTIAGSSNTANRKLSNNESNRSHTSSRSSDRDDLP